jgi:hypothetical protein
LLNQHLVASTPSYMARLAFVVDTVGIYLFEIESSVQYAILPRSKRSTIPSRT